MDQHVAHEHEQQHQTLALALSFVGLRGLPLNTT
jgi:hypothetical protein